MADTLTTAERSERMSRVRRAGNKSTELRLVALLRAAGICGWRRGARLIGAPDFVFRRERVLVSWMDVFGMAARVIDGCRKAESPSGPRNLRETSIVIGP